MITYVILLIAVVVLGVPSVIIVNKYPKTRTIFGVFFLIVIVLFSFLLVKNINKPISFDKEVEKRQDVTIEKLKDIRTIQVSYKDKYGKYTGGFDSLITFVKSDSFEIKKEVIVGKWNQDEMSKEQALKAGIIQVSSSFIPVKDSLWKDKDYTIETIKFVPFVDKLEFSMAAGELETASKVKVKVFECYAKYEDLYGDLDEQLLINYIDLKTKYGAFEGIKVGSLTEATNNAGNWEQ